VSQQRRRKEEGEGLFPLLLTPDRIVRLFLVTGEARILEEQPALTAFFFEQRRKMLVAAVLFGLFLYGVKSDAVALALVSFIAFDIMLIWLVATRLQQVYTRYVITTFRVLRLSGIFKRKNVWIPWVKITDLTFSQSLAGRAFGYATIRIETANEDSGLEDLSDIRDPVYFYKVLVEMVNAKQGQVIPPETIPLLD
jgi:membrane protein YdbS with pleckstrin-like domain